MKAFCFLNLYTEGLEFNPPFHLMQVSHDDWCLVNYGLECNCDPTIKIISSEGNFQIDEDGNFSRINEH